MNLQMAGKRMDSPDDATLVDLSPATPERGWEKGKQ